MSYVFFLMSGMERLPRSKCSRKISKYITCSKAKYTYAVHTQVKECNKSESKRFIFVVVLSFSLKFENKFPGATFSFSQMGPRHPGIRHSIPTLQIV